MDWELDLSLDLNQDLESDSGLDLELDQDQDLGLNLDVVDILRPCWIHCLQSCLVGVWFPSWN